MTLNTPIFFPRCGLFLFRRSEAIPSAISLPPGKHVVDTEFHRREAVRRPFTSPLRTSVNRIIRLRILRDREYLYRGDKIRPGNLTLIGIYRRRIDRFSRFFRTARFVRCQALPSIVGRRNMERVPRLPIPTFFFFLP